MKEKISALLTAKFAGVRKDVLMQMARVMALHCADETEAKALVDKMTIETVNEFVKEFRADVDNEVSKSIKTNEENLKKKYDFVEKKVEPGDPNHKTDPNDTAALIKAAVAEAVKPLQEQLDKYSRNDLSKSRLQQLQDKLNTCKDDFFKSQTLKNFQRMSFEKDEDFDEYLTSLDEDIKTANQNLSDTRMRNQGQPLFSNTGDDGVSSQVAAYVKEQTDEGGLLSGKKL